MDDGSLSWFDLVATGGYITCFEEFRPLVFRLRGYTLTVLTEREDGRLVNIPAHWVVQSVFTLDRLEVETDSEQLRQNIWDRAGDVWSADAPDYQVPWHG